MQALASAAGRALAAGKPLGALQRQKPPQLTWRKRRAC